MKSCARCGSGYKFWGSPRKRFIHLCDACAALEEEVQQRVTSEGLPALAAHYLPGFESRAVAVGAWKDMSSRMSSLGGSLVLGFLGLGVSSSFVNLGLVAASDSELALIKLHENLASAAFDYTNLSDMYLPSHYMAGHRGSTRAGVKRAALATITADIEDREGSCVLTVRGALSCKMTLPDAWSQGNRPAVEQFRVAFSKVSIPR